MSICEFKVKVQDGSKAARFKPAAMKDVKTKIEEVL